MISSRPNPPSCQQICWLTLPTQFDLWYKGGRPAPDDIDFWCGMLGYDLICWSRLPTGLHDPCQLPAASRPRIIRVCLWWLWCNQAGLPLLPKCLPDPVAIYHNGQFYILRKHPDFSLSIIQKQPLLSLSLVDCMVHRLTSINITTPCSWNTSQPQMFFLVFLPRSCFYLKDKPGLK